MSGTEPSDESLLDRARVVLATEARGLEIAARALDPGFASAVRLLAKSNGRVIVSGLGKSGLVGRKIAATLTSTGSPALFIHAVDALHGDLGCLTSEDVVILCSNSGETEELVRMVPLFRRMRVPLVVLTSAKESSLGRAADAVVAYGSVPEAGPVRLVPTTSTTVMLAVGDALAVLLMELRGFREQDFAFLHPGGVIGRRIGKLVSELMRSGADLPVVRTDAVLRDALLEILRGRVGVTTVVDGEGRLAGILTDGDLKRILLEHGATLTLRVESVMTRNPKTIERDARAVAAVERMENNPSGAITSLIIVDAEGRPEGIVHLHDCLKP